MQIRCTSNIAIAIQIQIFWKVCVTITIWMRIFGKHCDCCDSKPQNEGPFTPSLRPRVYLRKIPRAFNLPLGHRLRTFGTALVHRFTWLPPRLVHRLGVNGASFWGFESQQSQCFQNIRIRIAIAMFDVHRICMQICTIIRDYLRLLRWFYTIRIRIAKKLVRNIWFAFASRRNLAPQTSLILWDTLCLTQVRKTSLMAAQPRIQVQITGHFDWSEDWAN